MDQSAESTRDLTPPVRERSLSGRAPQYQPDDILGDRFVIVRLLGVGGNGEVYEAEDRELRGKHIALKTVRKERLRVASQSLEHELLIAREVLHPNICPTYDFFRMQGPKGPVVFITMKLLRGESLSARLRRMKMLTLEETLLLAGQMADGLDAAHRSAVIHRDFKPGNVMLVGSGGAVTVSITDFGLARLTEQDISAAEAGLISGTPGYIAPEIYRGLPASPASDVYSFGVVIREMLTGEKPGRSSSTAQSISLAGLPEEWIAVIKGCLKDDPADRFQSAGEALRDLRNQNQRKGSKFQFGRISRRSAIAAGLGGAGVISWLGWPVIEANLRPLPEKRFVALIAWPAEPAKEAGAILQSVLDAIATRLIRAEASVKNFLVMRPSDVKQLSMEPAQVVATLGANLALAAALESEARELTLHLRILDAATSMTLRERRVSVAVASARELPERASKIAAELFQIKESTANLNSRDPLENVSPSAFQDFALAEELRQRPNDANLDEAIQHYQQALEADPNFALCYAQLAMSYIRRFQITHEPAALRLASTNSDHAMQLGPELAQSVLSTALVALYNGRTQEAVTSMSRALRLDPGNTEILMYEARAFGDLGKSTEEEAGYRSVLQQRPNFWPAYNELGRVLYSQGKLEESLQAFQEACTVAPQVALPYANAGSIYLRLGRRREAVEMFEKSLHAAPNENAYLNLGGLAFEDLNYAKALDYYQKAAKVNPRSDITFRNIGDCYAVMGQTTLARENYGRAADLLTEGLKTNPRRGSVWMKLAFYDAKAGRRERVATDIREAEARGADDLVSQFMKAQAMAVMGRKEEALQLVLKCLDQGLSPVEVDLALDLKEVRSDSRYRRRIGTPSQSQSQKK